MKKPLADILNSTMDHTFEKVGKAIYSPSRENNYFGVSMLESIEETYNEFQCALEERNELTDYNQYYLEEYFHGIKRLKAYLTNSNANDFSEFDARIYLEYLQNKHETFEAFALEKDESYVEE